MKCIILKGIPASGKSYFAKYSGLPVVNGDALRLNHPDLKEDEIRDLQKATISTYASLLQDCIRDNTHINPKTLNTAVNYCKSLGFEVEVKDIFAELVAELNGKTLDALQMCVARNARREGTAKVPASVILEMYLKDGYKMTEKQVVIVDLDGTLYNLDHRLHYVQGDSKTSRNWGAFESDEEIMKDTVYGPVKDVIDGLRSKYEIFFVSGRKNHACDATLHNLWRDGVVGGCLLMRNSFDSRPDHQLKSDLLDIILKNHTVAFVLDDRKQVIDMWRSRGLYVMNCCQRESNDF